MHRFVSTIACFGLLILFQSGALAGERSKDDPGIRDFLSQVENLMNEKSGSGSHASQLRFVGSQLWFAANFDRTGTFLLGRERYASLSESEKKIFRSYFVEHGRQLFFGRVLKAKEDMDIAISRFESDSTARDYVGVSMEDVKRIKAKGASLSIQSLKDDGTLAGPGSLAVVAMAPELTSRLVEKNIIKSTDAELPLEFVEQNGRTLLVDAEINGANPILAQLKGIQAALASSAHPVADYVKAVKDKFALTPDQIRLVEESCGVGMPINLRPPRDPLSLLAPGTGRDRKLAPLQGALSENGSSTGCYR